MSETKEGLHNCFNKLSTYCKDWNLEVNNIIFNKNGQLLNHKYSFNRIYRYLGIDFEPSGKFDLAKEQLYKKAVKAFFYIN